MFGSASAEQGAFHIRLLKTYNPRSRRYKRCTSTFSLQISLNSEEPNGNEITEMGRNLKTDVCVCFSVNFVRVGRGHDSCHGGLKNLMEWVLAHLAKTDFSVMKRCPP